MGYYAQNPYEKPEPPRCLSCDEFKVEARVRSHTFWECRNPACEECPPKYQVVECSTCGEEYTYGEFCQNCTDGAAVGAPIESARKGVYCKYCEFLVEYGDMKPWRKDDDTVDMLCPGCDYVLVEGE